MPITTVHSTFLISCGKGNFDSGNRLFRDFATLVVNFLFPAIRWFGQWFQGDILVLTFCVVFRGVRSILRPDEHHASWEDDDG